MSDASDPSCMKGPFELPSGPTRSRRLGDLVLVVSVPPDSEVMPPLFRELGAMLNSGGW